GDGQQQSGRAMRGEVFAEPADGDREAGADQDGGRKQSDGRRREGDQAERAERGDAILEEAAEERGQMAQQVQRSEADKGEEELDRPERAGALPAGGHDASD